MKIREMGYEFVFFFVFLNFDFKSIYIYVDMIKFFFLLIFVEKCDEE